MFLCGGGIVRKQGVVAATGVEEEGGSIKDERLSTLVFVLSTLAAE